MRRDECAALCRAAGLDWRDDPTNADPATARGRLRRMPTGPGSFLTTRMLRPRAKLRLLREPDTLALAAADAERLGVVASLPQPSRSDLEFATRANTWHWQPTSMDISDDGAQAIVLTYGGVFLYPRAAGQDWLEALQQPPRVVSRSANRQAESIAFDPAGDTVFITIEQRNAPLFRLPVSQPEPED